jgi:hypothetical protein
MIHDLRFETGSPDCLCRGRGHVWARPRGRQDAGRDVQRPCIICSWPGDRPQRKPAECRYCLGTGEVYFGLDQVDPATGEAKVGRYMATCPCCRWQPFLVSFFMGWLARPWGEKERRQPLGLVSEQFPTSLR